MLKPRAEEQESRVVRLENSAQARQRRCPPEARDHLRVSRPERRAQCLLLRRVPRRRESRGQRLPLVVDVHERELDHSDRSDRESG